MASADIKGTLHLGPVDPAVVARPRLTDRLLHSPPTSLVVLCAPAGYAKTTTLAAWDEADHRRFLWVDCGQRFDDPAYLMGAVAEALHGVAAISDEEISALTIESSWPEMALSRLASILKEVDSSFVLAVDDAHLLQSEGAIALLQGLPAVLPGQAQLVISSRSSPPLHLGRMRANRDVLELGPTDLAMTRRESRQLLQGAGLDLDGPNLDSVYERTEGWPAALHLATLALAGRTDIDRAVAAFAGDDRAVVEYLRDEFLEQTEPELVEFMTRTSILERLSGSLCDAVLERTGSAALLRDLTRSNALVIPLDRSDDSFRYHHLLSDMLQAELLRTDAELVEDLHTRASLWFADRSETELAVEHAIESGNTCLAGRLIWDALPEVSGRGGVATLNRWLDEVGRGRLTECHGLLLTAVHCSLITGAGDDAAYWIGLASDLPRPDGCSEVSELDMLMLRTTYPMEGTASMGADAGRALELTAPGDVWHGAAALYRGVSMHLLGDAESAVPMLRDAARSTAVTSPVIQALALSQLALIACDGGQRSSAVRLISEARGQVDRCGLSEYLAMVLVGAVETMILALEGRTGRAHDSLANGLRLLGLLTSFPAWYEAEARLAFTAACLRLDELGSAHKLISEAREHLKQTPDAVVLVEWLNTLQVELDSRTGEISANSSKLTRAELRTLQHLPTHLSFRQIGEVDHVSTNTVKTQARSIYRKLGVGSRAEAVEAARKAGLLLEQS